MTTSSSTIDSTSTYYRQRVANAENDQHRVERLESLSADRLHKDGGFNLADPARYCRAHGFEDILNNTQPGTYGNWARHYLSRVGRANILPLRPHPRKTSPHRVQMQTASIRSKMPHSSPPPPRKYWPRSRRTNQR